MMKYLLFLCCVSYSLTAEAIMCPSNFKSIAIGDSISQVQQACGNPDTQQTSLTSTNVIKELIYYRQVNAMDPHTVNLKIIITDNNVTSIRIATNQQVQKSICESSVPAVRGSAIVQTTCTNTSVPQQDTVAFTTLCGPLIRLGDNLQQVEAACGSPAMVTTLHEDSSNAIRMTTWVYHVEPRPISLIFENGILKDSA